MMDACEDEAHVLDRFALHFGAGGFDLSSDTGLHLTHPRSDNDFVGADSLSLDQHHPYYNDPNLASNILDVSNSVMFDSTFSSINLTTDSVADLNNGARITASSVVETVIAAGADASNTETRMFESERQNQISPNDDKKSCTCKDCGKVFNSVWYLKQHAVKHSSERPFKCKYCHKTYRFRSNLYQHKCPLRDRASELAAGAATNGDGSRKVSSTAADSPHPSSESSSSAEVGAGIPAPRQRKRRAWPPLTSPTASAVPATTNGGDKPGKTKVRKVNPSIAESASDLNNHHSSADSPTSPSSAQQLASTKRPQMIILSEEEVQKFLDRHKDKLHKCPKCKSLWPSREYLTRHMEWHNDDSSRFRCVHCSETFVDEHRYGLHKQNHSPSSLHVCQRCRGKFSTRVALKKHARRCSLADSKNNGALGSGQMVNRSANGYRQALFIDPTPPPSPTPTPENEMQLAPAQQTSPSSFSDDSTGGTKTDSTSILVTSMAVNGHEKMVNGSIVSNGLRGSGQFSTVSLGNGIGGGGLPLSNVPQNNLTQVLPVVDAHSALMDVEGGGGGHWLSEHNLAHNGEDVHLQMERPYFYHAQFISQNFKTSPVRPLTPLITSIGLQSMALEQLMVHGNCQLRQAFERLATNRVASEQLWNTSDQLGECSSRMQVDVPLIATVEMEPELKESTAEEITCGQGDGQAAMERSRMDHQGSFYCAKCACQLESQAQYLAHCIEHVECEGKTESELPDNGQ